MKPIYFFILSFLITAGICTSRSFFPEGTEYYNAITTAGTFGMFATIGTFLWTIIEAQK